MMEEKDFIVECNVCGQRYTNHVGSTECCGSIAYIVEDGVKTSKFSLFGSINGGNIKPLILGKDDK